MSRGGCNCCGDWCTNAELSPNGALEWNYNYGQDSFNVGTISGDVYSIGQNALGAYVYNGNTVVRKAPFGSSHAYDLISPDPYNSNFTNSVYMKRITTAGKFVAAKQVNLGSFLGYDNWYDWNLYTSNFLQTQSSEEYMYLFGFNKVGFVENSEIAKDVVTGQYIGTDYKYVSNYEIGWDLIPKFMWNNYNTIWGWDNYFNYSPLAGQFGGNKKGTLVSNDTVLFGSYSTYFNYYNANGLTNLVTSLVGVNDDGTRMNFKVIGVANIAPIVDIGSKVLSAQQEAVNIDYVSNEDYVLNWYPIGSNQLVHTYDEYTVDGTAYYDQAKPFVSISAANGITLYDTDLLPNYADSVWADISIDDFEFTDGGFEVLFSLPLINEYPGNINTCNPESWPSILDNMVFGMNQSFDLSYDVVTVLGDGEEDVESFEELNLFFMSFGNNGYYGYYGQYWLANGYYYSPISITSSNFTGQIPGYMDAYQYFQFNPCLTELSPDGIAYHNLDILDFIAANFGIAITTPNELPVIPIDFSIDVDVDSDGNPDYSELEAFQADPLSYLGIPEDSQGTNIQFFSDYNYWSSPYQFNKVGYDGNVYAVMTVEYEATEVVYAPAYTINYPQGPYDPDSTITVTVIGAATAHDANPVFGAKSYMMNFDESFEIVDGFGLDDDLSKILQYDNANFWSIFNGYSPFFSTNPSLRNYLFNSSTYYWNTVYYNYGYNFTTSVDYIERVDGKLRFGINELFQKQLTYSLQLACLNDGYLPGATVPLVTNNHAIGPYPNIIVRDDTGELCQLLNQKLNDGTFPYIYNPNVVGTSNAAGFE